MRNGLLALVALILAGTVGTSGAAEPQAPAPRIVSVGGDATEIVFALGAGSSIVAIDDTSLYPEAVKDLPSVGYLRNLAAEGILSLAPDLVLAAHDAGPPIVLDQLEAAGVAVVRLPEARDAESLTRKISAIAAALGRADAGAALAQDTQTQMEDLAAFVAGVASRPKVMFVLNIGQGAPMASGLDTSANAVIALAGGTNPLDSYRGYKPLSPEGAVAAAPDVILVMEHMLPSMGGLEGLLAQPAIALTPAGKAEAIIVADGVALLGFGPRTPQALKTLAHDLHPDRAR